MIYGFLRLIIFFLKPVVSNIMAVALPINEWRMLTKASLRSRKDQVHDAIHDYSEKNDLDFKAQHRAPLDSKVLAEGTRLLVEALKIAFIDRLFRTLFIPSFIVVIFCVNVLVAFALRIFAAEKAMKMGRIPGAKLLSAAEFMYRPEVFRNVFQQIVGEWREEHYEALKLNQRSRLFWIDFRNRYIFFKAVIRQSFVGELFELVLKIVK